MPPSAQHNPFRTERLEQLRFRFTTGSWSQFMDRFAALHQRGYIVGPKGSGKTTLLAEIHHRLRQTTRSILAVQLTTTTTRRERHEIYQQLHHASQQGALLLIDGGEQLSWWQRFRLLNNSSHPNSNVGGWIVTQHSLLSSTRLLHRCTTHPELLAELSEELLLECPPHQGQQIRRQIEWSRLHRHHRGNLREAMLSLYDLAARG